jgi:hypothetical protein
MSSSNARWLLLGLSLVGGAAGAQGGAGLPGAGADNGWVLILSALRDEESYEHSLASFHFAFQDETWVSVTAGRSHAPSTEQDVSAGLFALGIDHDFGPIGFALSAEQWGDDNNLESRDWRGEVFFDRDRYRFAVVHEQRTIDIFFSGTGAPLLTDLRRVGIDADGLGLNWRFRVAPNWQTYGSWMDYDYPRGVRLIPRADRLDLLSTSTVTLAYSFIDRYETVGLEYSLGQKLITFDYGQDRSTIDGEKLRSIGASILWPVAPRMDLEFRLGSSRSDGFDSTVFGGLTLLIYGGR